ncbi:SRPBCC family protein [Sorangium sp. So ce119]|uniref:SRPBCC family protein n=1 Tax=Sorangium sp. So ce119 TaxID=3133279 RepID=UPI003F639DB7
MSPRPTGRVRGTATGADLVIKRSFRAPIEDVWQSVTASESTARWIGPWEGEAGPGKTVRLQMAFEKGAPSCNVSIDACEPPHHLAVSMKDDYGDWRLALSLTTKGDTTELTFVQHLTDPALAGDTGPGWEYYLDMLVASRLGEPLPDFSDYYPAQRAYYLGDARTQE